MPVFGAPPIHGSIDWGDGSTPFTFSQADDSGLLATNFTLDDLIAFLGLTTATLQHTYATPGTYTVAVTVIRGNGSGVTAYDVATVVVTGAYPLSMRARELASAYSLD